MNNKYFISFKSKIDEQILPDELNNPFGNVVPRICEIAAKEVQDYIIVHMNKWGHNFGLDQPSENTAKGKMFGVLIVQSEDGVLGYLATYSGKLQSDFHPEIFVPSLFDLSTDNFFLTKGMTGLSEIGNQIKELEAIEPSDHNQIESLKEERKLKSAALQDRLFDQYHFLNRPKHIIKRHLSAIGNSQ